jgi:hypothetical protein
MGQETRDKQPATKARGPSHAPCPTSHKIVFRTAQGSFQGLLNDSAIAKAVVQRLPIASEVKRWGDEVYFDVPVTMSNTRPTLGVTVGDIAYWPEGPCLCIFFGKTPASRAHEPRPASDVTIVGHTEASIELLRSIEAGTTIGVALLENPWAGS